MRTDTGEEGGETGGVRGKVAEGAAKVVTVQGAGSAGAF